MATLYKYLGILFDSGLSFNPHVDKAMAATEHAAKILVGECRAHGLPFYVTGKALVSKIWPSFLYKIVPVLHHREVKTGTEELEKKVARTVLRVPEEAGPDFATLGELGWSTRLYSRVLLEGIMLLATIQRLPGEFSARGVIGHAWDHDVPRS